MSRVTRDQFKKEKQHAQLQEQRPPRRQSRKDAELKSTPNGEVVNFSIAINETWKDKKGAEHKNTDWFEIEVWGPMTKFAATLRKGAPVTVEGKIKPRTYTANEVEHKTVSIKANSIRRIDYNTHSETAAPVIAEDFDPELVPF